MLNYRTTGGQVGQDGSKVLGRCHGACFTKPASRFSVAWYISQNMLTISRKNSMSRLHPQYTMTPQGCQGVVHPPQPEFGSPGANR